MEERPNKRPTWARRRFFVNEHFQLHFVAFSLILSLTACVVFYAATSWFFTRYHGFAIDVGLRPSDPFFKVLYNMEMMLTNIFIGTSVGVILASIIGGILFSHRVAGPMYRLRKHMEESARDDKWADVSFRKNDYFGDVAEAYNGLLQVIRRKVGIESASIDTADNPPENATTHARAGSQVNYETPIDTSGTGEEPKLTLKHDDDKTKKAS